MPEVPPPNPGSMPPSPEHGEIGDNFRQTMDAVSEVLDINAAIDSIPSSFAAGFVASEVGEEVPDGQRSISPNDEVLMRWESSQDSMSNLAPGGMSVEKPAQTDEIASRGNLGGNSFELKAMQKATLDLDSGSVFVDFASSVSENGSEGDKEKLLGVIDGWVDRAYEEFLDPENEPSQTTRELLANTEGIMKIFDDQEGEGGSTDKLALLKSADDKGFAPEFSVLVDAGVLAGHGVGERPLSDRFDNTSDAASAELVDALPRVINTIYNIDPDSARQFSELTWGELDKAYKKINSEISTRIDNSDDINDGYYDQLTLLGNAMIEIAALGSAAASQEEVIEND